MLKQGAKQLFYKIVDFFGWIKIPITTLATIYSILVTIDTDAILCGSHPAIAFLHWSIFEHKFALLISFLCILTFIAILEKFAIGSYTKLKQELKEKEDKLEILNNYIKELFDGLLMSFANAELAFGTKKTMFILKNEDIDMDKLSENVTSTIDIIIERTKKLYWKDFINFVYSTYPIVTSERYTFLNLVQKAEEYHRELAEEQEFAMG